jgi:membrane-associated protease RseP (regulator of RpoE activity)
VSTTGWLPSMSSDDRVLALEQAIEGVFAIHDVTVRSRGQVVVFRGQFLRSPELVFAAVSDRLKSLGSVPLLRQEDGADILVAYPAPAIAGGSRAWVNIVLFIATVLSTLLAGTWQALPDSVVIRSTGDLGRAVAANWTAGIPFAAALLGILGIHELGHYFTARHYGLDVTPPYFIPFPLNPLTGTLGAVIRIRSPFESRKALFDVGIAGPLAGLAVAVPVVVIGLMHAQFVAITPGNTSVAVFNEPLLFQWLALLVRGPRPVGADLALNPLLMAGWWGFFLTALNLLPTSQLDGGHINYALFGSNHRYSAWGMLLLAVAVAAFTRNIGFFVMAALILAVGVEHPPALNDLTPIGRGRRILGFAALALFFLLITPDPFAGSL